ncbi:hypothetical protein [Nocardia wallacei]|uniref:hypothetical protein n=1 Tax=Nocardia wallacei TaxID=480035 RepID=UPI002458C087|nr:hypothetical protein [Nocardia wallacei]
MSVSGLERAATVVAGAIGVAAGAIWVLCVLVVLDSRWSTDPAADPHGYRLIFATILSVPAAVVAAVGLPFVFPRRSRTLAAWVVTVVLFLSTAVLFVALAFG